MLALLVPKEAALHSLSATVAGVDYRGVIKQKDEAFEAYDTAIAASEKTVLVSRVWFLRFFFPLFFVSCFRVAIV